MPGAPKFNPALSAVPASGIRRIANAAEARRERGLPVYAFHLGEPGFDTPEPIKQATLQALQAGQVHYAPNAGIPELRTAIADDLNRRYRANLEAGSVLVTVGACEALALSLLGVLEPGQEVIVPTPCWPNYLHLPRLAGAEVVEVPTRPEEGFRLQVSQLEGLISPRTRAIVINSPNNPTGAMLGAEELRALLELAREHGVWLISDEIYQDFSYTRPHVSVLEVCQPDDPVILVGGFSKTYAMTGWRLGYLVTHPSYANVLLKLHQYLVTSASHFPQWGALRALSLRDEPKAMAEAYRLRRERVIRALERVGIQFVAPEGAFYVFARVPGGEGGDRFCERMLLEHGLGFVPGGVFGQGYEGWFRLCFAASAQEIEEGMVCLEAALGSPIKPPR